MKVFEAAMTKVRETREKKKLSLREFATSLGIDCANYCNAEKGKRTLSLDTVEKVHKELGLKFPKELADLLEAKKLRAQLKELKGGSEEKPTKKSTKKPAKKSTKKVVKKKKEKPTTNAA